MLVGILEWAKSLLLPSHKDFSHVQIFIMENGFHSLHQWEYLAVLKMELVASLT